MKIDLLTLLTMARDEASRLGEQAANQRHLLAGRKLREASAKYRAAAILIEEGDKLTKEARWPPTKPMDEISL